MSVARYLTWLGTSLTEVVPAVTSSGPTSAGKIVALNTDGVVDPSMIPVSLPRQVANVHLTAQSANLANTQVAYAVPADGCYRISMYCVVTRAATTSSTLPNIVFGYTELDSGVVIGPITGSTSGTQNTVGTCNQNQGSTNTFNMQCKGGTNITYGISNYASSGATSMQFSVRIVIEQIGAA